MDEIDLPPLPPSQITTYKPSRASLLRKRPRSDDEPTTSSDPALFSSDEPLPSADNYAMKRRKEKWRGTWWGDRLRGEGAATKEKRQFKRNYDSGIWMGSEGTDSSLEEELLRDQRECQESQSSIQTDSHGAIGVEHQGGLDLPSRKKEFQDNTSTISVQNRAKLEIQLEYLERVRSRVQAFVEMGHEDIDLSDMRLDILPSDVLQPLKLLMKHSAIQEPPTTHETFAPLVPNLRIYLANNSLSKLPSTLFDFQDLCVLSLRHNELTEIPPAIGRLSRLRSLNVANNKLKNLPYELLELIRAGELTSLVAEPNPWMEYQPSDMLPPPNPNADGNMNPSGLPSSLTKIAESTPEHFYGDGTRKPTTTQAAKYRTYAENAPQSTVPSLIELALRACSKLPYLKELPELLMVDEEEAEDVSAKVHDMLALARDVHASGGRRCTLCRRPFLLPRKLWLEWWSSGAAAAATTITSTTTTTTTTTATTTTTTTTQDRRDHTTSFTAIPFLRRQCSEFCVAQP